LRLFRGRVVLPLILRSLFLPLALKQLSPLAYRRFCAEYRHIRRIVDKIIGGKLRPYSLGVACRSSISAAAFCLERIKAFFILWPTTADLSSTLIGESILSSVSASMSLSWWIKYPVNYKRWSGIRLKK